MFIHSFYCRQCWFLRLPLAVLNSNSLRKALFYFEFMSGLQFQLSTFMVMWGHKYLQFQHSNKLLTSTRRSVLRPNDVVDNRKVNWSKRRKRMSQTVRLGKIELKFLRSFLSPHHHKATLKSLHSALSRLRQELKVDNEIEVAFAPCATPRLASRLRCLPTKDDADCSRRESGEISIIESCERKTMFAISQ